MTTARGFLGAGSIYLSRYDSTSSLFLPPQGPYENTKFEIKAVTKLVEQTSRSKEKYGQILESVAIPQPTEFSMDVAEVNRESMAYAVLGTIATLTQASGTATDEVVTASLGAWSKLAKNTVTSGSVIVTNSGATVTYVEGTDYEVNYTLGWIRALVGGAIADAASLKVDYTYGAVAGHKIRGATAAQLRAQIMFDGTNLADGSPCIVECWEAVISSSAAFNFMDDKFNSVPMTGRLKTPTGKTEPFEIRLPQG